MVTAAIWPALDYSRVPYSFYHDADLYAREQEQIFRGPVWSFSASIVKFPTPETSGQAMSATRRSSLIATGKAPLKRSSTA